MQVSECKGYLKSFIVSEFDVGVSRGVEDEFDSAASEFALVSSSVEEDAEGLMNVTEKSIGSSHGSNLPVCSNKVEKHCKLEGSKMFSSEVW